MKTRLDYLSTHITALALVFLVVVGGLGGWVWNIVKLAHMGFDPLTGMAVLRIVGIFLAPLGAILGYC